MQRHFSSSSIQTSQSIENRGYETFEPTTLSIPVKILSHDREERMALLNIHVQLKHIGITHHQALVIEINDENDPFFLYTLECGESDFHALKHEQSILVDFFTFPHKFLELLEMCTNKFEPQPKFICILERHNGPDASLNIVETNYFKQLTHLSLRFRTGNDETLKKYLAQKLKEIKGYNEELEEQLKNTTDNLRLKQAENNELSRQLYQLSNESEKLVEQLRLEEQSKVNQIKEEMLQKQTDLQKSYDQERQELVQRLEQRVSDLGQKSETQIQQISQLSETKYLLEAKEKELQTKLNHCQAELDQANQELFNLRGANRQLDSTKYSQEKSLTEYTYKLQNLEKQLQDKEDIIQQLQSLLQSQHEQRASYEENTGMLKHQQSKLEEKLKLSAQEILKGNAIIQKLQGEIKSQKQKLKLKNQVVLQQEHILQQKHDQLDQADRKILDQERQIEKKDSIIKSQEQNIGHLQQKLEEQAQSLQSNGATIQYLNNRLNDIEKTRPNYVPQYKPQTQHSPQVGFKLSNFSLEQLRSTPQRPPSAQGNFYQRTGDLESYTRPTEPVKYKEPT